MLNLTWDRADFKASLIRLQAEDTKTGEPRIIPLTPELTASLRRLYKVRYLHEHHVFLVNGRPSRVSENGIQGCLAQGGHYRLSVP
ncbi:MAG TPA: hypothetical protein EYN18_03680 [Nitrospirales bacterium]|nr:hypothetical protein [Nitrospirales bacterium]HIC04798.1 hypothetical protein [Nitrospirales bacterium]HIO21481.1 hypothetical protein [Nitrospirales bacterium]HIO69700.1 hypothetical protein [Nitrospirales bacterium]